MVAADEFGVPDVHVSCFLAVMHGADYGLDESLWADGPYLTLAPRALEDPVDATDAGHAPLPRGARAGAAAAGLVGRLRRAAGLHLFGLCGRRQRVFPAVYRGAVDALADEPIRVLLTLGTEVDPLDLGPVPDNVHVERWVPQGAVMPHAAAMVGHGGSGSTLMAMAAGMPLAVVPLFADQPINAARVAALGAGLALNGVDALATAVRSLLAVAVLPRRGVRRRGRDRVPPPIDDVVALLRSIARGDALAA